MLTPTANRPGSFFGNFFNRAKSAFSRWREVRQLDCREIEAVARDLNISPADLVSLMSTSSDSESLNKRLAYEGLSAKALAISNPDELRDLRRVCGLCNEKARCARDLRHKRMATPAKYCPNELTLQSLAREAHHERLEQVLGAPSQLV